MGRKLLLFGGGGHCHSIIDSVLSVNKYDEIGIIDNAGSECLGIPVVGSDGDVSDLVKKGWTDAFISVGSVGSTEIRRRILGLIKSNDLNIATIIDPAAVIARGVILGQGVFVGKNAVINTNAKVGDFAIINTGAIIEHDCEIGDFAHVSTGAVLCGHVRIGNDTHIGAGSVVRQQISIGSFSVIGVGSVVVKDVESNVTAFGNPCCVKR